MEALQEATQTHFHREQLGGNHVVGVFLITAHESQGMSMQCRIARRPARSGQNDSGAQVAGEAVRGLQTGCHRLFSLSPLQEDGEGGVDVRGVSRIQAHLPIPSHPLKGLAISCHVPEGARSSLRMLLRDLCCRFLHRRGQRSGVPCLKHTVCVVTTSHAHLCQQRCPESCTLNQESQAATGLRRRSLRRGVPRVKSCKALRSCETDFAFEAQVQYF